MATPYRKGQVLHSVFAAANSKKTLFFGIPPNHQLIADLGAELISLRLVFENSPELEGDSVARREVAARL
ncbi:hypothetical protein, partial [Salmonella sp. s54234]|uniref:hypothetical protein n=1 Tax=Salmonella sp. s54234 TaxID=3159663 RepID=UPI00397EDA52